MIQNVPLSQIQPNPFQTRMVENPEHVQNLAESIGQQGLLQIPSARENPSGEGYQLAFGHSRFAAFKILAGSKEIDNPQDYETMPLNIVELDDQGMFEQAVAENRDRKDLNAIEEAMAMVVYKNHFKKTSEQIGELFHLSDSAVRNKMRLLDLPDEVKIAVTENKLSESVGRELLTYFDLPAEVQNGSYSTRGAYFYNSNKGTEIVEEALKGANAEDIHENISRLVKNAGVEMDSKPWKHTDEFHGEKIVGICKGCAFLLKRDKDYCLRKECFDAKLAAFRQQYLEQASLLSGIPVMEEKEGGNHYMDTNTFGGSEARLEKIRAAKCENLRLTYDSNTLEYLKNKKVTHLGENGFPNAQIVCCKRNGFCTCLKAMDAGVKIEATEDGAALAKEDLKEINRQVRAQHKYNAQVVQDLITQSALKISDAIDAGSVSVWEAIFLAMGYSQAADEDRDLVSKGNASLADIKYFIGKFLTRRHVYDTDPKWALKHANENLRKLGLEELPGEETAPLDPPKSEDLEGGNAPAVKSWVQPGMIPEEDPHPAGKTLAEVFAEDGQAESLVTEL